MQIILYIILLFTSFKKTPTIEKYLVSNQIKNKSPWCEARCCGCGSNSPGTSEPPDEAGSCSAGARRGSQGTSSPPWGGWSCQEQTRWQQLVWIGWVARTWQRTGGLGTCCCELLVRPSAPSNARCHRCGRWARTPPDGRSCSDGTGCVWLHRVRPPPPPTTATRCIILNLKLSQREFKLQTMTEMGTAPLECDWPLSVPHPPRATVVGSGLVTMTTAAWMFTCLVGK